MTKPLAIALFILAAAGCASSAPEPAESEAPPVAAPVAPAPAAAAADPRGPIPDRDADPVAFWNWRVDQMFLKRDADQDGSVTRDEFGGAAAEFDNIDADKNGSFTKEELSNYVFARYVMAPQSPTQ